MTSGSRFLFCLAATCSTLLLCTDSAPAASRPRLDLTGQWDFYPDVGDAALDAVTADAGKILVPGAWQAQGYGEPGGSIPSSVVGSDITPANYLRHNLTARCLYVRDMSVPAAWQGQRVFLCVRRVYLEARPVDWLQDVFAMPRIAASQVERRVTVKTANSELPRGMSVTADVAPWDPAGRSDDSSGNNRQSLPTTTAGEQVLHLPVTLAALLDAQAMPAALRDGAVVWGLGLTAWISTEKDLRQSLMYFDVITERDLHLVLCNLDLLTDKPESRYVLAGTIDYLLSGKPSRMAKPCSNADVEVLLR